MKLLEKILMPIDVNQDCKRQTEAAIKIATEFNSEVTIMYVLPESKLHPEIRELFTRFINEKIDKIVQKLEAENVSCSDPIISTGSPDNKILDVAIDLNVNLILAGSGNESGNEKYKLGTTAEKLVQLSDVPVWVTKSDQETELKKIMCPVDFSDASKRALRNAILLTNNFNSTLYILGVFEPFVTTSPRIDSGIKSENHKLQLQFEQKMNEFVGEFKLKEVNHVLDVKVGIAHEEILKWIQENEADLLVMGTNGRSGFSRMVMGSVTEKVIRELPCSFVTTKTQNIFQVKLDNEVKEIETHFNNAAKLYKSGLYNEAIDQYLKCLQINDMHVPSMYKLAKLYKILGDQEKMEHYDKMASDILRRLWDKKIEFEIRKHYKSDS